VFTHQIVDTAVKILIVEKKIKGNIKNMDTVNTCLLIEKYMLKEKLDIWRKL
jgi:hypothetical protein